MAGDGRLSLSSGLWRNTDGTLPRYQVDRSFNYVDSAYERPGPVMKVYRLRNCSAG